VDIIEDGKGKGYKAEVTTDNQLVVQSESVPSEAFKSFDGKAFIIHAECHTAVAASGGLMTILNNDTAYDMEITRIYIDACTLTPSDMLITQVFDADISNGTDVSSTAVIQKNRNTAESFDLTVTVSDASSDMTYTGGTQYHRFAMPTKTSQQRDMNGTNIIPATKSVTFGWLTASGGNATDGEIISLSVNVIKRLRV